MPRRKLRFAAVAMIVLWAAVNVTMATPARAAEPPAITHTGAWSMSRLHYSDLTLSATRPQRAVSIGFPPDAAQGPTLWWQIYMRVTVSFLPTGHGIAYLTGRVNGAASASIEFDLDRGPAGVMYWNSVDINGQTNHFETGRTVTFDYTNYVANAGIRPGIRTLSFDVESLDRPLATMLDSARVDAAHTGLIWNSDGYDDLHLTIGQLPHVTTAGDVLAIPYTVTNSDKTPARGLQLAIGCSNGLEPKDGRVIDLPAVAGPNAGVLHIALRGTGPQKVTIQLLNSYHHARSIKIIDLNVEAHRDRTVEYVALAIAAALMILGLSLAWTTSRRRHAPAPGPMNKCPSEISDTPSD